MGIKASTRSLLRNAPVDALNAIDLPALVLETKLEGKFDYIHLFVISQAALHEHLLELTTHVKLASMLWVSWQKTSQLRTDLTLTKVIQIGYECGLVESKNIRLNEIWSVLKFTHHKKGKIHTNSFGKLKVVGIQPIF